MRSDPNVILEKRCHTYFHALEVHASRYLDKWAPANRTYRWKRGRR